METVGRLAGGVAHDFNNILSVIMGYSELVEMGLVDNGQVLEDIQIIKESAEKAAGLTRQLLAFSRKQVLEMQIIDLNSVINNMAKMLRRMIGEDITLDLKIDAKAKNVIADPGQIEQVIMNLAVNARDAMPNGGRLVIETKAVDYEIGFKCNNQMRVKPGRYTMVTVSDTGTGMSREIQDRIFEPFFTTKEMSKGTGLGLSTVYGITKHHKGYVHVHSEKDKGTCFNIYLPIASADSEQVKKQVPITNCKGSETILVVEDDPPTRRLIVKTLKPLGYNLLEAPTGEEAVRLSISYDKKIDLLLTDVIMPGMNGHELNNVLAAARPETKVLFMSGYTDDFIAHHGVLEEGAALLQKPFTSSKLAGRIRGMFDEPLTVDRPDILQQAP